MKVKQVKGLGQCHALATSAVRIKGMVLQWILGSHTCTADLTQQMMHFM